ncbi:PH domain-containing protein [Rheinheimera sp. NSM]|uniref:PH domain-containing protein n=1 Tax=Rheinheimera sp. NSM TaxID=3457884 RepID=UPI004035ACC6
MMQRFDSKKDFLLVFILIAVAIVCTLAAVNVITTSASSYLLFAIISIMGVLLPLWLLTSTYYLVDGTMLKVKSGPFRWTIQLSEIAGVKPSDNPISSPALSLDRLEISYANGKKLLVSPKDQPAFINALQR